MLIVFRWASGATDWLAWSPDSQSLLSCGSASGVIQQWSIPVRLCACVSSGAMHGTKRLHSHMRSPLGGQSGDCRYKFHHPADSVTSVQWLPNSRQFLSGAADKSLLLWVRNNTVLYHYLTRETGNRRWSSVLALTSYAVATVACSGCCDQNVADGSVAYQWGGRRVLDMAVHPDGQRVFVLISGVEIRVFDLASKADELFFRADELVSCICLAPSGKFLLVNLIRDEEIVCLEVDAELIVAKYSGLAERRYVLRPCFSGHDEELVVCGSEGVCWWDWCLSGYRRVLAGVLTHLLRRRRQGVRVAPRRWRTRTDARGPFERDQHCREPSWPPRRARECKRRRNDPTLDSQDRRAPCLVRTTRIGLETV